MAAEPAEARNQCWDAVAERLTSAANKAAEVLASSAASNSTLVKAAKEDALTGFTV